MFPKVFQGLGIMGEAYSIKLKPGAKPQAIYAPRNVCTIELFVTVAILNLPASSQRMDVYKSKQKKDYTCATIANYC